MIRSSVVDALGLRETQAIAHKADASVAAAANDGLEKRMAAAVSAEAAKRGINLDVLIIDIESGGKQAETSAKILKTLMTAVAAVALRPNELNSNAIEQQKEKWAKRDYFVDHAMKDIEKLKGNPNDEGLPEAYLIERAAHNNRVTFVSEVHAATFDTRALSERCLVFAFIGILLMIIAREIEWSSAVGDSSTASIVLALRAMNSLTTIMLLISLFQYHSNLHFLETLSGGYLNSLEYWPRRRILAFAVEFLICLIHDIPVDAINSLVKPDISLTTVENSQLSTLYQSRGIPFQSSVSSVLLSQPWTLFMFLRFYLLLRVVLHRRFGPSSYLLSMFSDFQFNIPFTLRVMMSTHPLLLIWSMFGCLLLLFSFCLHVCERSLMYRQDNAPGWNQSYFSAFWMTFNALSLIGASDTVPLTVAGRCIIVLCNIFGVVLLSSMVSAILTLSKPLIAETRMIEFVELKHFDLTVRDSAARIIAMTWRQFKLRQQLNRLVKQLRFSWLESLKMTTPIRIQLFILQRRLCSEMLIFDHARQISVLGSENRSDESIIRVRLQKMLANTMSAETRLVNGQREIKYSDNYVVNQMTKLFKSKFEKKAPKQEEEDLAANREQQLENEIEAMHRELMEQEAELEAMASGADMEKFHRAKERASKPPTQNEQRLLNISEKREYLKNSMLQKLTRRKSKRGLDFSKPDNPFELTVMGKIVKWPVQWPVIETTASNLLSTLYRRRAFKERELAVMRAAHEEEQAEALAAFEKRAKLIKRITEEESLCPVCLPVTSLCCPSDTVLPPLQLPTFHIETAKEAAESQRSHRDQARKETEKQNRAALGLPDNYIPVDKRVLQKSSVVLRFQPKTLPRNFKNQHIELVNQMVIDADQERADERKRLRMEKMQKLQEKLRSRKIHHHHHHLHQHLVQPHLRKKRGDAPPSIVITQTLLDEVEEMSTQLLLLCKSITTAMSTCSERIADIGSEVDVLLETVKKAYGVI